MCQIDVGPRVQQQILTFPKKYDDVQSCPAVLKNSRPKFSIITFPIIVLKLGYWWGLSNGLSFDQIWYHFDGPNKVLVPKKRPNNIYAWSLKFVTTSQVKLVFLISDTFCLTFNSLLKTEYFTNCDIYKIMITSWQNFYYKAFQHSTLACSGDTGCWTSFLYPCCQLCPY